MKIEYYVKVVYGIEKVYVASAEQSAAISKISGAKTLTKQTIVGLQELGFEFVQVLVPSAVIPQTA